MIRQAASDMGRPLAQRLEMIRDEAFVPTGDVGTGQAAGLDMDVRGYLRVRKQNLPAAF